VVEMTSEAGAGLYVSGLEGVIEAQGEFLSDRPLMRLYDDLNLSRIQGAMAHELFEAYDARRKGLGSEAFLNEIADVIVFWASIVIAHADGLSEAEVVGMNVIVGRVAELARGEGENWERIAELTETIITGRNSRRNPVELFTLVPGESDEEAMDRYEKIKERLRKLRNGDGEHDLPTREVVQAVLALIGGGCDQSGAQGEEAYAG